MTYTPANWYWIVAGSSTQVYSSASGTYVPVADATYQAWVAAGNVATKIGSVNELVTVLIPWNLVPVDATVLAAYLAAPIRRPVVTTFAVNGTYTPATNLIYAIIECVGGGGGGGGVVGAASSARGGGGGGGGSYCKVYKTPAQIGTSQAVTIGAGGVGSSGIAGTSGGTTSVGSLCIANGGAGGNLNNMGSGFGEAGTGGTPGVGDFTVRGGNGRTGLSASITTIVVQGGAGGSSAFGPGGVGSLAASGSNNAGGNALGSGDGGGGAANNNVAANSAGGNGGNGFVFITEYLS